MDLVSNSLETFKFLPTWLLVVVVASGSFKVLNLSASFLRWVYVYFLRPGKNLRSYGSWAVITGCTDGIGRALAFELAGKGLDLVMVGRNPDKLKAVSDEILAKSPNTLMKTVVFDLAGDLSDGIRRLRKTMDGLDVGVLVNNAGLMYPSALYFHEVEEGVWRELVKVNVEALTMVTQAVLPGMLRRKRGAIVNIGSGSSVVVPSHPLFAIYAATKAYVESFSRSLHVEYRKSGIDVQCQVPLYVATKMVGHKKASFFVPLGEEYARAAVRCIGHDTTCMAAWTHSIQWFGASLVPEFAMNAWRLHEAIKLRAPRKKNI